MVYNVDTMMHATNGHDFEVIRSQRWEAKPLTCKVKAHVVRDTWILFHCSILDQAFSLMQGSMWAIFMWWTLLHHIEKNFGAL